MSAQVETWRVSTPEGVFEADLETLKQWIVEGCVLPTDKVSKGSLGWIDAGRAPMLRSAFAGEVSATKTESKPAAANVETSVTSADRSVQTEVSQSVVTPPQAITAGSANVCHNHVQVASKYICRACANAFCNDCPKFFGTSNVPLCPLCGDLCTLIEKVQHKVARHHFQSSGFGLADLVRALQYPLQHKVALLFGAGLYGFLLLAGFRGRMVASVIMFGCISHVISQVAWGRMDRSFMPDFSAFSMWDDVAVPIGLGIGITVVTWGPTIVLVMALLFGVFSGAAPSAAQLVQGHDTQTEAPISQGELAVLVDPEGDPQKQEEASKKLGQLRPGAQIGKQAEASQKQLNDPAADLRFFMAFLGASIVFVVLLLLSLAWGLFYYPMALAVAGYTQSIASVVNPLVGLDTIRRMGLTYFKAFGMVILIQLIGLVLAVIVAVITAPLALPFFGNLPAMFIDGSMTFYFNLVIACVLGLSLFKCADRLGIQVD